MGIVAGRSLPNNGNQEWTFANQGLGDIQIHPKLRFLNATRRGLGFAIMPSVILGTGDRNSFLGEGKTIFQPMAILDTELGYLGRFRAAINAGMRIRGSSSIYTNNAASFTTPPMSGGADITTGGSIEVGNEVLGGWASRTASCRRSSTSSPSCTATTASLRTAPTPTGAARETMKPSAEAIGGIKLYLARNSFFEVGAGWKVAERLRLRDAARVHRHHLRAEHRRPRRRRLQGRRRPVPGRSRGLRRLRGRGRLPRARQRQRRHPRRSTTSARTIPRPRTASRTRTAAPRAPRTTATATASSTTSTSARTIPRTSTTSRTRTAAPIRTTTRTASSTSTTCARTIPRTRTASRTRTAAPIPTTTRTASSTSATSARTSPRPTTASRTTTAAPIKGRVDR